MTPQCREAGIETGWCPDDLPYPDILGKESGKPANESGEFRFVAPPTAGVAVRDDVGRNVDVSYLAGGMDAGVSAPGGE